MLVNHKDFLKTYEISGKIIEMINSSKSNMYIITPYLKPWVQLERALEIASNMSKKITFVLRAGEEKKEFVKKLYSLYGFEVFIYEYLHLKLYIGDQDAIFSSMNLYDSSNEKNIELGLIVKFPPKDMIQFKKEYIYENIFLSKPLFYYKGNFENEYAKFKLIEDKATNKFDEIGYCVLCGKKIDHHKNPNMFNPVYTRCGDCYYKNPNLNDNHNGKVNFCYICGIKGNHIIGNPYHDNCIEMLKKLRPY